MTDLDKISIQLLIYRAQLSGDVNAIAELIRRNQSRVRSFLFRLTKQHALADDIAQDTFVVALEKIGTFRGRGTFEAWLLKIAYNRFLKQFKSSRRRNEILDIYELEQSLDSDENESNTVLAIDIERALLALDENETSAFSLCVSYGFSHSEAAEILQLPLGTLKSMVSRAKSKLRSNLVDFGETE